jgi:transposase
VHRGGRRQSFFDIAASTAVKWIQRLRKTGSSAAKPRGGSTLPLEEHTAVILGLIGERPDGTFQGVSTRPRAAKSAVWRHQSSKGCAAASG